VGVFDVAGNDGTCQLYTVDVVVVARPAQGLAVTATVAVKVKYVDPAGCADEGAVLFVVSFVVPSGGTWNGLEIGVCFRQRYKAVGTFSPFNVASIVAATRLQKYFLLILAQ
jgi:hypothetical protein